MNPFCKEDFTKSGTVPSQPHPPSNTEPEVAVSSKEERHSNVAEFTPLNTKKNTRNEFPEDYDGTKTTTTATKTTPSAEPTVSPEILMKTPATGHHHHVHTAVSGVTDNRKCRARGLLCVAETGGETPLPLPSHASIHWLTHRSPTLSFEHDYSPATTNTDTTPNVIRTPGSEDSDPCLNSVAESLTSFSFEFGSIAAGSLLSRSSSVDLSHFHTQELIRNSCCSENDDADQSDCCRFSSDNDNEEEEPDVVFDDSLEPEARNQNYVSGACSESISTDGGGPLASKDSDWDFDLKL